MAIPKMTRQAIADDLAAGMSCGEVAEKYGIGKSTAEVIKREAGLTKPNTGESERSERALRKLMKGWKWYYDGQLVGK